MLSDISQQRLELAQFVQADAYINSQEKDLKDEVMKLTDGHGADVIIVAASSNAAQEQALDIIAPRGRISLLVDYQRINLILTLIVILFITKKLQYLVFCI